MRSDCRLVLDSWDKTGCSGNYAHVDEFVEGKSVNLTVFTSNLVSIDKITISHVLYKFDKKDETVVFIEQNNTIFMGDNMIDSLDKPIGCEDNDVRVDLRSKIYYPHNNNSQSITFSDGTSIPV